MTKTSKKVNMIKRPKPKYHRIKERADIMLKEWSIYLVNEILA